MAKKREWIVTTSSDRPIQDVAKDLAATGFSVGSVLDEAGCITGAASDAVVEKLRGIAGVVDVSPDAPIDLGPPDAPETW
jgi:hypothetical protein